MSEVATAGGTGGEGTAAGAQASAATSESGAGTGAEVSASGTNTTASNGGDSGASTGIERLHSKHKKIANGGGAEKGENAASATEALATPAAAPWTPNYKFKAFQEEHEFEDWVKPLVNQETEEKFRKLYAKAFGFDGVKPKYDKMREEYSTLQEQYSTINKNLDQLSSHLQAGDFGTFFDRLQIPKESIMKWVADQLRYEQLPPEQRMQVDQQNSILQQKIQLERQNQELSAAYQRQMLQSQESALHSVLSRPDVSAAMRAFDERLGAEGSFRNEVIRRGAAHYSVTGVDLPPEQVVMETIRVLGLDTTHKDVPSPVSVPTQTMPSQAAKAAPTLPNIASRGTSPAKKVFKSIDELRKHAQSLS